MNSKHLETIALHAGHEIDPTGSRQVPVYRTTSYQFRNTEHAANLFSLKELGNIYTRLGNPTQDILEKRVAAMEGGAAAVAIASGTSALFYAIINIAERDSEIVSAPNIYGGSYTMFDSILPELGVSVKFADSHEAESFEAQITEKTRALVVEVIGNPKLDVANIRAISDVADRHGIPLIVDSTFTTPYHFKPIEHGATVVVHSLTKWMGGHGAAIGGIVVDSGKFDWTQKKFKLYNEPDSSYHGLRYGHDLGDLSPIAFALRLRLVPLRNLGAAISPDNAWLILQGIETLSLRMERHSQNAITVARFLKSHPSVSWVRYPGLEDDPSHEIASKQLQNGFGSVVVFGVNGGREAGERFINSLKLFSHLANVGDAKSLAIHPASTTHSQLSAEQMEKGGITEDLIRLSIGIEHIDDIIADIENALK